MSRQFYHILDQIRTLGKGEQLILISTLTQEMAVEEEISLSEADKQELRKRIASVEKGETSTRNWEDARADLSS